MGGALAFSDSRMAPRPPATNRSRVVAVAPVALTPPSGATGANQSIGRVAGHLLSAPLVAGANQPIERVAGNLLSAPLAAIERRRAALGIEPASLCRAADVPERTYRWWRAEGRTPPRPVLQRLDTALDRFARGATGEAAAAEAALIEATLGGFRVAALASLPMGAEGQGGRAALAAHVALYCANQFVGLRQARLAAHRGLTRPAVHLAIRRVEALRDACPRFDAAVATLARSISRQED